ncbi:MAG: hypothetical protein ABR523_12710, partial [Desulfurivibrionaceae bacterium]
RFDGGVAAGIEDLPGDNSGDLRHFVYPCAEFILRIGVTVQQHHIFGRSARLTYTRYAAPIRLSKSAALLNGYSPAVLGTLAPGPVNGYQLLQPITG